MHKTFRHERHRGQAGFTLVEALVSLGILATSLVALAQLFALATTTNRGARTMTNTAVLAQQKMEQLRSLTWGFDEIALPVSDTTSDITAATTTPTGGVGLTPGGSLTSDIAGYVDYLDEWGRWMGNGTMPSGVTYIRRWTIEPLPTNPNNTLIFQVLVTRVRDRGTETTAVRRLPGETRLVSVKTRKSQ